MKTSQKEVKPAVETLKPSNPSQPLPLALPSAFNQADKALTEQQLQFAAVLAQKFPGIVTESELLKSAAAETDAALQRMGQKYYAFCAQLRAAKMNRRESTLLMKALGFHKQRITEILRVSEVDDAIWSKYANGEIGFKSTLQLGRGTVEDEEEDDGGEPAADSKKKKKEKRLPKEFQPGIIKCLEDWGDSLKATGQKEPYVMRYEDADKRTYVVTIQPIDAKANES